MKILIVHNSYQSTAPSGEDVVVKDEAALLESYGHTVIECFISNDSLLEQPWPMIALRCGMRTIWSRFGAKLVESYVQQFRPDVVHFHNVFPQISTSAIWRCKSLGVPVVMTVHNYRSFCANGLLFRNGNVCEKCPTNGRHWSIVHGCYRDSRLMTFPIVINQMLSHSMDTWNRAVDRLVALTQFAKEKLIKFGINHKRIVVKPNFAPKCPPNSHKERSGFLYAGRLMDYKGIQVILKAAQLAPDIPFFIAGDGPLSHEVQNSGLDNLKYLGCLTPDQTQQQIAQHVALLIPSLCYEGFPRTVSEAMSVSTPVIGSDHGALSSILIHNETGLLHPPGSSEMLIKRCRTILENPQYGRDLGMKGHQMWIEQLSPQPMAEKLITIYNEAMHKDA